jgi:hypothetical protein
LFFRSGALARKPDYEKNAPIMRSRSNQSQNERTMTMNFSKQLLPKTLWLGAFGLAAILLGSPSCKAQEVSPAHFTDTGVEDTYPVAKPSPKKPAKVQIAANVSPVTSGGTTAAKPKAHKVARKPSEVPPSSL